MINIKHIISLAAITCLLASCQSNSYHIQGVAEGLEEGDTLFYTNDLQEGLPSDTIIIKDGKFSYESEADSVYLAMIYSAKHHEINATFFVEPGDISIKLSNEPGTSRVSGTTCNDQWQELMDSVIVIGKQINLIAEHIYGKTISEEEQMQGMARIEQLNQHFADVVVQFGKRNIKNELGYFILTTYPQEMISNETRLELIKELPDEMRQRPAIKQIQKAIEQEAKTQAGQPLPDFSQPGPDGKMVNIKDEWAQHRITIIDFWASWCQPCRQEMPNLVALYTDFKDKGLGVVGVSLDENATAWTTAISQMEMPWTQMSDLKGWENAAAKMLNITSIPHTIVVDQQGKILQRGLRGEQLRTFVASQLK